jgi:predicted type IV restriction endonuclease
MRDQLLAFVEEFKSDKRMTAFDEAATKQIVLLRILSLLGWNTYNIDEVVPEYSVGNQRVDYALRHSNMNKAFIEVKKVGEDLDRHQEQLLNYSFDEWYRVAILFAVT